MRWSAWFTIWTSPRSTIQQIVQKNPNHRLWWLATIYGFASLCGAMQSISMGSFYGPIPIFLIALILAPIWGYVIFAIWSFVVMWTGKLFKGSGQFKEIRAAYAWSCVPMIVSDAVWVILLVLFGSSLFVSPPVEHTLLGWPALVLLSLLLLKVVCAIWSLIVYLNALAQVQGFSILRAIGNIIVGAIAFLIALGIVSMLIAFILNVSLPQTDVSKVIFPILQEGIVLQGF
jgi:hypothetical protein